MHATDGAMPASVWKDAAARRGTIASAVTASVWAALALAAFLLVRRMNGAFSAPLPFPQLVGTALAITAWSLCVSAFASRHIPTSNPFATSMVRELRSTDVITNQNPRPFEHAITIALPTIALALFAIACSSSPIRFADWLIWLPAIAISAFAPQFMSRLVGTGPAVRSSPAIAGKRSEINNEQLLQQTIRTRAADGAERIEAMLVAQFPPGERIATLYIAFCPPFEQLPEIEVSATDGPDAETKIVQLLHNGAQLEVRLDKTADASEQVTLELVAQSARPLSPQAA